MNDVLIAKKASLEKCVSQVRRYSALPREVPFAEDFLLQDAVALNIQRACELAIDMANHLVRQRQLGVPQSSRESFSILAREGLVEADLAQAMMRMVGFRNVLVHRYQELDLAILESVMDQGLEDLLSIGQAALVAGSE